MKTFLHDKTNDLYFKGVSEWTDSLDSAFNFGTAERAAKFVRNAKLPREEMEVVLTFDQPGFNVAIPLDQRFETASRSTV
jgi:hypothetical protein